jgi:hypothetical protein
VAGVGRRERLGQQLAGDDRLPLEAEVRKRAVAGHLLIRPVVARPAATSAVSFDVASETGSRSAGANGTPAITVVGLTGKGDAVKDITLVG